MPGGGGDGDRAGEGLAASAAGRGNLRVPGAEREQVIDALKAAFVRGSSHLTGPPDQIPVCELGGVLTGDDRV